MTTWNIDPAHSSVIFGIRHLVISTVRGRISTFGGTLELDEADLTKSKVHVDIDPASIDTGVAQRDAHLRMAELLDVEAFPKASFTSTSIATHGDAYDVTGDLTLHGVTKPIELHASFGGKTTDLRGTTRVAFSGKTTIDREAFGITWNKTLDAGGLALGTKLELLVELQAIPAG